MDIYTLGDLYSTDYYPDKLVGGLSSKIWTERFLGIGEFELTTPDVDRVAALLPEDMLITHAETKEVMIVETQTIADDENGVPTLTVKGRDLRLFLDNRFVDGPYGKRRKMRKQYSPLGAAGVLLWQAFDNGSGKDVTRGDSASSTAEKNDYSWNTLDKIPNVAITDSGVNGTSKRWWLEKGTLGPQLQKIMLKGDIGIRCIRPEPDGSSDATILTVKTNLADRGDIVRTWTTGITALRFDLYTGIDRSEGQSVVDPVIFSTIEGNVSKAQYLWSLANFRTIVELMSSVNIADYGRNAEQKAYSGIQRRVLALDVGEPEIDDAPEKPDELKSNATAAQKAARAAAMDDWIDDYAAWKNKRDAIVAEFKEDAADDAAREMKNYRRERIFTGDISPLNPYEYGVHYNLGDTVTMYGDYDVARDMIVAEFTRAENENGETGIPGLVLP